jgi:trehalose/maltose hydrolase-like predicted phosphorylase
MGNHNMKKSIETDDCFCYFNYYRFTGDYLIFPGLEVLIGIARFWHQRANFSKKKINM